MSSDLGFDEASVLRLVGELHAAHPNKGEFSLNEIAEALAPAEYHRSGSDDSVHTWMESLNSILKKLAADERLDVAVDGAEVGRASVRFRTRS